MKRPDVVRVGELLVMAVLSRLSDVSFVDTKGSTLQNVSSVYA